MREVKGQRVFYLMLMGVLILGVLAAVRFVPRLLNRQENETAVVGSAAPDFTLRSAEGAKVSLDDFRNHQSVLLYFSMGPG